MIRLLSIDEQTGIRKADVTILYHGPLEPQNWELTTLSERQVIPDPEESYKIGVMFNEGRAIQDFASATQ